MPLPGDTKAGLTPSSTGQRGAGDMSEQSSIHETNSVAPPGTEASVPDDEEPPPYGEVLGQIREEQQTGTRAVIGDDGRVNIRIEQPSKGLQSLLVPALRSELNLSGTQPPDPSAYVPPSLDRKAARLRPPPLNISVQVVGSRGDVQPFVALGKVLKEQHGHRVRLATHPVFQSFVEDNGLEFFSIGGDPSELMAFMVKNPGLMPGFDTLRSGDIGKRRREIGRMVKGSWRSCFEAGNGLGAPLSDNNMEEYASVNSASGMDDKARPFVADAIIANPPSFAHIHCAEKLGIPLHMMFTMPWSPTQSFPHPLANIQSSNADTNMTNFISYALVDMMTWQGLGDIINRFRQKSLGLEPISLSWAPGMLARLKIPYTYCWSPALIPKPRDWASYISISGFYFLSLASNFTPDPELSAFLESGPPPVYIGFGSIVVDDPDAMTKLIFDAVKKSGQRALVSKGWGGFGADQIGIPEGVYMLGNVPHDWLFKKVSCVVHHGGAGTTAAGIACGKPTVVVPFFGDQPFWGHMVAKAGAGPSPVPYKELTGDKLAELITTALKPSSIERAKELSEKISHERGSECGAQMFHEQLDLSQMRCQLSPNRAAAWRIRRTSILLSAFAASVLGNEGLLNFKDLKLHRPREWETDGGPWEPITGGASALVETMGSMAMGVADLPVAALKAMKIHPEASSQRPKSSKESANQASDKPSSPQAPSDGKAKQKTNSEDSKQVSSSLPSRDSSPSGDEQGNEQAFAQEIGNRMTAQFEKEQAASSADASASSSNLSKTDTTQTPRTSTSSANQPPSESKPKFDAEAALESTKGAWRFTSAGIKSPMDFTLSLAKGFHNAPKLYGDDTVRKPEKVTDFSSGIRAASKGFGLGLYDGISGLVTQPVKGAQKEGAAGFVKGFGKGIGGVVFKPGAAFWGIPGYTSQGIYKELQKAFGPSVEGYIIAARTAQGYEDVRNSTEAERSRIVADWKEMRRLIYKKPRAGENMPLKDMCDRIFAKAEAEPERYGARPGRPDLQRADTAGTTSSGVYSPMDDADSVDLNPLSRIHTAQQAATREALSRQGSAPQGQGQGQGKMSADPEFEEAIQRSVRETSRGNPEEDAMIERAIRESVDAYGKGEGPAGAGPSQEGLSEQVARARGGGEEGISMDDNEGSGGGSGGDKDDDEQLRQAMSESRAAQDKRAKEEEDARREEDTVMRYVMRQSEAEEKMRREREGGGQAGGQA